MKNALNLLVFDDGLNRKGLSVGKELFRLGRGEFHLNTLLGPPRPEESLTLNPEGTIVFLDYSRVGHWRRAEMGDPALPPWARGLKFVYLIGLIVAVSDSALRGCVEEIRADLPRFTKGLPALVRTQSTVRVPTKPESRLSPR